MKDTLFSVKNNKLVPVGANVADVAFMANVDSEYALAFRYEDDNSVSFVIQNTELNSGLESGSYFDEDHEGWSHWSVSFDASSLKMSLYKNDAEIATQIATSTVLNNGALYIGQDETMANDPANHEQRYAEGRAFPASMDELRVWMTALPEAAIATNFNARLETSVGLVSMLCFDEARDIGKDCSGTGNSAKSPSTMKAVEKTETSPITPDGKPSASNTGDKEKSNV